MRNKCFISALLVVFIGVCVLTSSANAEYNSGRYNFSRDNFTSVPHAIYIWDNRCNQTIAELYPDSNKMGLIEGTVKFLGDSLDAALGGIWSACDSKDAYSSQK
jgi:hypothetical protein